MTLSVPGDEQGFFLVDVDTGHLGSLTDVMALSGLGAAEMVMADLGLEITLGSGVAAAQEVFRAGKTARFLEAAE